MDTRVARKKIKYAIITFVFKNACNLDVCCCNAAFLSITCEQDAAKTEVKDMQMMTVGFMTRDHLVVVGSSLLAY